MLTYAPPLTISPFWMIMIIFSLLVRARAIGVRLSGARALRLKRGWGRGVVSANGVASAASAASAASEQMRWAVPLRVLAAFLKL